MKGKKRLILLASLAVVLLASLPGVTGSSFVDLESSTGNAFQAWTSTLWQQTTQSDFEAGVASNVDTSSSPGDVKLVSTSGWYSTIWPYRKQITFTSDSAKIPSTQSYFPVLIGLSSDSNLAAHGQDDGDDILFTSSDGTTQLDHEIEEFDGGTGELVAWVEVPSLSTGTVIYMYYGHATCGSQQDVEHTWDGGTDTAPANNYVMVQHLQEASLDGSDDEVVDSTVNDNDGKGQPANGGYNGPTPGATGQINSAFDFDGSDDYVDFGHGASLNITASVTLEGWINMDADPGKNKWYEGIAKPQYDFYLGGTGDNETTLCAWFKINGQTVDVWGKGDIDINPGNDTYLVVTFDGTDIKAYVNGQLDYTHNKPGSIDDSANDDLLIGAFSPPADYFYGIIDEVRISNIATSADWIKTCYNNQSSPSSFHSVADEEGFYIASQVLDTGVAGARWDALFWDETVEGGITDITFEVRASDASFAKDTPPATLPWTSVGGTSPVTSGLPSGKYMQWRATLTTSDTSKTPTLHEVRVYHY